MNKFVRTETILDKILDKKVDEVTVAKQRSPLAIIRDMAEQVAQPKNFREALHRDTVALIAEVKKASPSKGLLMPDFDHLKLGTTYANNGASAISVLTDETFFQGHLDYLQAVSETVNIPTLRKDFIIDAYQIYEAKMVGASAVLLIVAALDNQQLADLYALINELGMEALVEVHNEAELERAMSITPRIVGVNNRDLKTFDVDLTTTERIANLIPNDVTLIAESGLKSGADVAKMGSMGAHAVLIGEGLVTSNDIASTVSVFSKQARG